MINLLKKFKLKIDQNESDKLKSKYIDLEREIQGINAGNPV